MKKLNKHGLEVVKKIIKEGNFELNIVGDQLVIDDLFCDIYIPEKLITEEDEDLKNMNPVDAKQEMAIGQTKENIKDNNESIAEAIKSIKTQVEGFARDIRSQLNDFATKDDLSGLVQNIKNNFVTKEELESLKSE
jgi:hypothetical protein